MEMIWIILIALWAGLELILLLLYVRKRRAQKRKIIRSLYKLVEEQVLDRTLKERITSEQAALMEYQKPFLYVEFPDTRPLLMCLFSLDECVTIGRSRENKICIRDDMLSRFHCKISLVGGRLVLQDMMAVNGTKIRRRWFRKTELLPGQQEFLYPGDTICVGNYRMKIRIYYGWVINT